MTLTHSQRHTLGVMLEDHIEPWIARRPGELPYMERAAETIRAALADAPVPIETLVLHVLSAADEAHGRVLEGSRLEAKALEILG